MCSPSYGFHGMPVVARMCVYTAQNKLFNKLQKCTGTRTKKHFKNEQNAAAKKGVDTRGVGISNIRCKVQSMDDNCGEWVECMCVASGCG